VGEAGLTLSRERSSPALAGAVPVALFVGSIGGLLHLELEDGKGSLPQATSTEAGTWSKIRLVALGVLAGTSSRR
jgi:hypothetical protein